MSDAALLAFVLVAAAATWWNVRRIARWNSIRNVHDGFNDAGRHDKVRGWNPACPCCTPYCSRLVDRVETPGFTQRLPCGNALPCVTHPTPQVAGREFVDVAFVQPLLLPIIRWINARLGGRTA